MTRLVRRRRLSEAQTQHEIEVERVAPKTEIHAMRVAIKNILSLIGSIEPHDNITTEDVRKRNLFRADRLHAPYVPRYASLKDGFVVINRTRGLLLDYSHRLLLPDNWQPSYARTSFNVDPQCVPGYFRPVVGVEAITASFEASTQVYAMLGALTVEAQHDLPNAIRPTL